MHVTIAVINTRRMKIPTNIPAMTYGTVVLVREPVIDYERDTESQSIDFEVKIYIQKILPQLIPEIVPIYLMALFDDRRSMLSL